MMPRGLRQPLADLGQGPGDVTNQRLPLKTVSYAVSGGTPPPVSAFEITRTRTTWQSGTQDLDVPSLIPVST
ncbi:hypothetical protein AQJ66_06205 [Streptomyces bungoensis]|uniref:Uncharacterized protein n=1 Tax=Streptomyces bungoensis TaxID=285568 RepID=A0A101TB11_9ACTN|nr:hypothetical protein AQJ66_06205 [Streptomyces bungoensis]